MAGETGPRIFDNARRPDPKVVGLEDRYRALVETIPHGIQECDTAGMITLSNSAHAKMHGYHEGELVGKYIWDMLEEETERQELREYTASLVEEQPPPTPYVTRDRTKDGKVIDVQVDWDYRRSESGDVVGFVAVITDITERKKAEEALRLSAKVIDNMSEGIQLTRFSDGIIVYTSSGFDRLFGYGAGELIGRHVSLLNAPLESSSLGVPSPIEMVRTIVHSVEKLGEWHGDIRNVKKDGTLFWTSATVTTFEHGEYGPVWLTVQRDITERIAAEEMAQEHRQQLHHVARVSTMGEMATGIAHELNQPLTAVATYADACALLVRNGQGSQRQLSSLLDKVAEQAVRAGQIVRRLRSIVRKSAACRSRVHLNQLIRDAMVLLGPDARMNSNGLELRLVEPMPPVLADHIQIEQVLLNLVRNAVDAMREVEHTERKVIISTAVTGNGAVEVAVSDTGRGISDEHLEKVFEAFFTTRPDGMGMGLAICRSIIEANGGSLWFTPNPDRGVTFRFMLPTVSEKDVPQEGDVEPAPC